MVRGAEIGNKNVELTHIEEAFTSEHWMVRQHGTGGGSMLWRTRERVGMRVGGSARTKPRSDWTSLPAVPASFSFAAPPSLQVRIYRVKNEKTHPNFQEKLARKGK